MIAELQNSKAKVTCVWSDTSVLFNNRFVKSLNFGELNCDYRYILISSEDRIMKEINYFCVNCNEISGTYKIDVKIDILNRRQRCEIEVFRWKSVWWQKTIRSHQVKWNILHVQSHRIHDQKARCTMWIWRWGSKTLRLFNNNFRALYQARTKKNSQFLCEIVIAFCHWSMCITECPEGSEIYGVIPSWISLRQEFQL